MVLFSSRRCQRRTTAGGRTIMCPHGPAAVVDEVIKLEEAWRRGNAPVFLE
jgi:hypothetical protein